METKFNVLALLSLIFGLVGLFVLPLWFGIAALILSIISFATYQNYNSGKGMTIAGLVLGIIDVVWYLINYLIILGYLNSLI